MCLLWMFPNLPISPNPPGGPSNAPMPPESPTPSSLVTDLSPQQDIHYSQQQISLWNRTTTPHLIMVNLESDGGLGQNAFGQAAVVKR